MMPGLVSLVGAGPGDPELLTVRAACRLGEADLVLYDALVPVKTLSLATRARCLSVGKRAGRTGVRQATINALMCRSALLGQRVVRLKCGDPFVLGRGGEEALALAAAGVTVEVVPGVSTALAAPALAGIPVTHRGVASAVLVLSGHAEHAYRPVLESLAPESLTIVVLMGMATRQEVTRLLLARGWNPRTPAALATAASMPHATTWIGVLRDLPRAPVADWPASAGTIVVGRVVDLAARIGLRETDVITSPDSPDACSRGDAVAVSPRRTDGRSRRRAG